MHHRLRILALAGIAFLLRPAATLGCATCFGQTDSPLAKGMNWGILAMLVVVVGMWIAFGTFFVYLARRASKVAPVPEPAAASPAAGNDLVQS